MYCITVSYGRMGYPVITSTSASLQATAMASLPVISESLSTAGFFTGDCAIASAMSALSQPCRANSLGSSSWYWPR